MHFYTFKKTKNTINLSKIIDIKYIVEDNQYKINFDIIINKNVVRTETKNYLGVNTNTKETITYYYIVISEDQYKEIKDYINSIQKQSEFDTRISNIEKGFIEIETMIKYAPPSSILDSGGEVFQDAQKSYYSTITKLNENNKEL